MKIDTEKFTLLFDSCRDCTNLSPIAHVLEKTLAEDKREKAEKAFENTSRIMRAESQDEIDDLSIEDLIECIQYENVYNQIFVDATGDCLTADVTRKWKGLYSRRPRRLL